jgi:hypothetical protein
MCCHKSNTLLEVRHVIGALVLPVPLHNTILVDAVVASSLPSVAALSGPIPNAFLLAQLVQGTQTGRGKDVVETRNAQAICCVRFPFGVYDDLQVGLGILWCIRQGYKPAICRALVAVRDGDKFDIGVCSSSLTQVKEGLLSDCSWSVRGR